MLILGLGILLSTAALTPEISRDQCVTHLTDAYTKRVRASSDDVMKALLELKDKDLKPLIAKPSDELRFDLKKYFDSDPKKSSRLESFYALLYLISREINTEDEVHLDRASAQQVLKASRVFPSSELIEALEDVSFEWRPYSKRSFWTIKLSTPLMKLPMNDGKGFLAFEHGYCQQVEKLILDGGFQAFIQLNEAGNIDVKFKNPIDFEGKFGSRGVAEVEVHYISLYEIEFIRGTKLGASRTKIAKREFEINDHSWFLRFVSRMISDVSTQTIDW